ncbi:uncharacterized protein LOC103520156 [Diaphorina citri]|uniref:Uncharacterized protein LOC103520156 n=1 Tax=Diaphorina citri TaxID=121845 RepID=A0A3Q0JFD0_DIACI|nr:uncharacterized protein LOC103520156 [Diaphorina citri]
MSDNSEDEYMDGAGKFIKIAPFNPKDIDLTKPPTNGEEFLQRVLLEKRSVKSKSIQINRCHFPKDCDLSINNVRSFSRLVLHTPLRMCTEPRLTFSGHLDLLPILFLTIV